MQFETGKTYKVIHDRKGTFDLKVTGQCDEWVSGVVVGGKTEAMLSYNVALPGDPLKLRKSLLLKSTELATAEG